MTNSVNRFHAAVTVLAGDGHIKQRLIRAYTDNLVDVEEDELPLELQERFADARKRMHCVAPLQGEGPIRASVRKMSAREASECAIELFAIYSALLQRADASGHVVANDGSAPAPFLVKSISG